MKKTISLLSESDAKFAASELAARSQLETFEKSAEFGEIKRKLKSIYGNTFFLTDFLNIKEQKDENIY